MPKVVGLKKKFSIAGKDVVAIALISQGIPKLLAGDYAVGGAMIGLGAALMVIQQFI